MVSRYPVCAHHSTSTALYVPMCALSRVPLSATPWTAAHQAPPSMGFSSQEYWSGLPLTSPETPRELIAILIPRLHSRLIKLVSGGENFPGDSNVWWILGTIDLGIQLKINIMRTTDKCNPNKIWIIAIIPEVLSCLFPINPFLHSPRDDHCCDFHTVWIVWNHSKLSNNYSIYYYVGLLSLRKMLLRFTHVIAYTINSLLYNSNISSYKYTTI